MSDENYGESWKTAEDSQELTSEMAVRYMQAGTTFLCSSANSSIVEAKISKVSPNGRYVVLGFVDFTPFLMDRGNSWIPVASIRVHDIIKPFVNKEEEEKKGKKPKC